MRMSCLIVTKMNHLPGPEPYAPVEQLNQEEFMDKWECPCGYVYDPAEGDIENNIPPGTAFEDLPEEWVCPVCGAEKSFFDKV